ncbi:hypothetical protein OsI_11711 [Oryza sativa Indica Group]|uniref:Uncharacterized protein n=1 Tax=Oryza sativa subsp. indica TaxID=39946 RepID=A2XH36_ORYSI|nr:hypothetical protein OsI_11711 [Oryza sativa Indica Group]
MSSKSRSFIDRVPPPPLTKRLEAGGQGAHASHASFPTASLLASCLLLSWELDLVGVAIPHKHEMKEEATRPACSQRVLRAGLAVRRA